jgi:hypothetical protein
MAPTIKLKDIEQLRKYMQVKGLRNDGDLAKAMRIDRSTVFRTLNEGSLGTRVVAALLATFNPLTFEDLFEIVEDSGAGEVDEAVSA